MTPQASYKQDFETFIKRILSEHQNFNPAFIAAISVGRKNISPQPVDAILEKSNKTYQHLDNQVIWTLSAQSIAVKTFSGPASELEGTGFKRDGII